MPSQFRGIVLVMETTSTFLSLSLSLSIIDTHIHTNTRWESERVKQFTDTHFMQKVSFFGENHSLFRKSYNSDPLPPPIAQTFASIIFKTFWFPVFGFSEITLSKSFSFHKMRLQYSSRSYRVCHEFKIEKQYDYFWGTFDHFWSEHHFFEAVAKNWLEPITKAP